MLASELLRRIVPSGSGLDVQALAALAVVGQASCDGLVSTDTASITGDLDVSQAAHVTGALTALAAFTHGSIGEWCSYAPAASIDLTAAAPAETAITPSIPGYVLIPSFIRFQVTAAAGTATGGGTAQIGNNGARNNYCASQAMFPTAKHLSGLNSQISTTIVLVDPLLDLTAPLILRVTVAPTGTGGFTYQVRPTVTGILIPLAT